MHWQVAVHAGAASLSGMHAEAVLSGMLLMWCCFSQAKHCNISARMIKRKLTARRTSPDAYIWPTTRGMREISPLQHVQWNAVAVRCRSAKACAWQNEMCKEAASHIKVRAGA